MIFEYAVFAVVFVVALGGSIAMLFARNAVHAALFLVATQLALAIAFLLQGAYFIAAIQVIVYAGAIMVLFLFVIMLLGVDRQESLIEPLPAQRPLALGLGALLAVEVIYVITSGMHQIGGTRDAALQAINEDPGNVLALGRLLFSRYLLPFEVTSVLLVVGVVGVMVLTRRIVRIQEGEPGHLEVDDTPGAEVAAP